MPWSSRSHVLHGGAGAAAVFVSDPQEDPRWHSERQGLAALPGGHPLGLPTRGVAKWPGAVAHNGGAGAHVAIGTPVGSPHIVGSPDPIESWGRCGAHGSGTGHCVAEIHGIAAISRDRHAPCVRRNLWDWLHWIAAPPAVAAAHGIVAVGRRCPKRRHTPVDRRCPWHRQSPCRRRSQRDRRSPWDRSPQAIVSPPVLVQLPHFFALKFVGSQPFGDRRPSAYAEFALPM